MRVLIATWGWRSHFLPLAPLGWALRAAGHEVHVACQPEQTAAVTGAGLPAVPCGAPLRFADVFRGQVSRVQDRAAYDAATAAGTALDPSRGAAPEVTADGGVVRFADAMLDDLVAFARHLRPDLIVYEPFNIAAALVAAALEVPSVRLLWGPDSGTELHLDEERIIAPRAARLGAARVRLTGSLTLDPCPAALQVPLDGPVLPVRFIPYNGTAVLPAWLREPARKPRICVTWGTMMAELGLTDLVGVPGVVRALAGFDVEVVLAVEPPQRAALGDLPDNVRIADHPMALHLLLPTCAALVHQGGAGTLMTGLATGVPQLILPQVSDQHFNADRLFATGAGFALPAEHATDRTIRDRVVELLEDPARRLAATDMRRQFAERPTPTALVPVLEQLATAPDVDPHLTHTGRTI